MKRLTQFFALSFVLMMVAIPMTTAMTISEIETATGSSAINAAALYARHCSKCHGRDGTARSAKAKRMGVRSIASRDWQDGISDERIFNSIQNGRDKMPAYSRKLKMEEVEALVDFVRRLRR